MIKLYNTLSRKKEEFKPIKKGEVGMYSCGPTVYWYQHIGNLRSYIFADLLRRTLEYNGFKVNQIINVTDVGHLTSDADSGEDKVEKAAEKEGKKAEEITRFYFNEFQEDFNKLNIEQPKKWVWATQHIKDQIELIKKLEKKGFTYKTQDGIYYDSSKFKKYGELARLKISGLQEGKRVSTGDKKNKTDFALWKFSSSDEKRQQEWQSPWGVGFPGWHIECSAMSMKYLGERFDIHTGGEDHIPVHHTNEIAQSEASTGKKFVNYWLHGAFLVSNGKKVSKSTGGLYTISELEEKRYDALAFRYLCLTSSYRKQLNFSLEALDSAQKSYDRLRRRIIEIRSETHKGNDETENYRKKFKEAINDDLNMPKALEVLWKTIDDFDFNPKKKIKLLEEFDEVLGLRISEMKEEKSRIPSHVLDLVNSREKSRMAGDYAEADLLRERIKEEGFIIEDSSSGPKLKKI